MTLVEGGVICQTEEILYENQNEKNVCTERKINPSFNLSFIDMNNSSLVELADKIRE